MYACNPHISGRACLGENFMSGWTKVTALKYEASSLSYNSFSITASHKAFVQRAKERPDRARARAP